MKLLIHMRTLCELRRMCLPATLCFSPYDVTFNFLSLAIPKEGVYSCLVLRFGAPHGKHEDS